MYRLETNRLFNVENRKTNQKVRKFPVIFPVLRELEGKEWGRTGFRLILSACRVGKGASQRAGMLAGIITRPTVRPEPAIGPARGRTRWAGPMTSFAHAVRPRGPSLPSAACDRSRRGEVNCFPLVPVVPVGRNKRSALRRFTVETSPVFRTRTAQCAECIIGPAKGRTRWLIAPYGRHHEVRPCSNSFTNAWSVRLTGAGNPRASHARTT